MLPAPTGRDRLSHGGQSSEAWLMPMDILAVRETMFHQLKDRIGLIYREAMQNGKVVYDAAA